jgi:predicted alpha/beta superfamily hydrolase
LHFFLINYVFVHIFRDIEFKSKHLKREVIFDIIGPSQLPENLPLLLMNDGQDFDELGIIKIIENHLKKGGKPFLFVGIHCNANRMQEYGVSGHPDYKKRGGLATNYMNFITKEFLPHVRNLYQTSVKPSENYYCGFSLGGLSAFDITWENSNLFSKVGVFSGSFWWRDKDYVAGYVEDNDRIMHKKLRNSSHKPGLQFWLECGTEDEKADRNKNGIIDAIDDTMDIIKELKTLGYKDTDIEYVEIPKGQHNFGTWSKIFPAFLEWAF